MINRALWLAMFGRGGSVIRYFRRNKGTTDYATIPAVTLTGDFVIEFETFISSATYAQLVSGLDSTVNIRNDDGLAIAVAGVQYNFTPTFTRGAFNRIKIERVAADITATINGISQVMSVAISDFIVSKLYDSTTYGTSSPLNGILANLKIYDNGTLIRDYPLNEPKGTSVIYDIVGGNNGAIVNGDDEDRGLFTKQADGNWKGSNLDVPPWGSVDQALPVA